jgi:cytochrome c-type biogenesis protein CcmE
MTHRYIKIGATALVLVLAFGLMMWSTLREGTEYYKNIDEVMVNQQDWHGKQLQLHGYVVPNSILVKKSTLEYKFKVQNNPARSSQPGTVVDVTYKGIVPDTFKDEAEVVLKGKLSPTGFHTDPNGVMAKCPSKYEEAQKAASAGT